MCMKDESILPSSNQSPVFYLGPLKPNVICSSAQSTLDKAEQSFMSLANLVVENQIRVLCTGKEKRRL